MAGAQSVSGARPSDISTTGPTATLEKEPPYGSHWKTMPRTLDLTGRPTATQEKEPRDRSPWKQGQAATLTKPTEKQEPGPWI